MIHPHIRMAPVNDRIGVGLFAAEFIPRGTITWVQDPLDIVIPPAKEEALGEAYRAQLYRYSWRDAQGRLILCWDHARFMNHGCSPNSQGPGLPFEIALRDIQPGEEILCDYGALNLEEPFECLCGDPACRGTITPDGFDTHGDAWDDRIRHAFGFIGAVPQPLMSLIEPEIQTELAAGLRDPAKIPSIRAHQLQAASQPPSELDVQVELAAGPHDPAMFPSIRAHRLQATPGS